jgi:tRNA-binding EMAP/Myf-like protein
MSELLVGTIVSVDAHQGARAPSFLLEVDLGPRGREQVVLSTGDYEPADLEGAQILCSLGADGTLVLGAQSHAKGLVLLRPDREVEPGSPVA